MGIMVTSCLISAHGQTTDKTTLGKQLFEGSVRFENKGPSCISCHNVNSTDVISGGLYSKDLTKVYTRFGDAFSAFMDNPQNGMLTAYGVNSFTAEEKEALTAFFKKVDAEGTSEVASGYWLMLVIGLGGVLALFALIYIIWWNRKKESVKKEIFDRQLSAIN